MDLESVYHFAHQFWIVWLVILLVAIVFWAYRPKNKKRFEDDAQIPFKDDE
jgi:cytochrome c oxidase cbb3-type subunit 4